MSAFSIVSSVFVCFLYVDRSNVFPYLLYRRKGEAYKFQMLQDKFYESFIMHELSELLFIYR